MSDKEREIWKTYPEFPFIEASNLGRIRTKDRYVPNGKNSRRLVKGHVLEQYLNPYRGGYLYISFCVNYKTIHRYVHQVIAITFISNPYGYLEVNHIDNDPTNNEASNLEWCTSQYNNDYKKKFGTSPEQIQGRPVLAINLETSEALWFETQTKAGLQLGVNRSNISMVVNGRLNKAKSYWFCNADENAVEKTRVKFGDEVAKKVEELINEHCNQLNKQ